MVGLLRWFIHLMKRGILWRRFYEAQLQHGNNGTIMSALNVIKKTFPQVEKVIDATKSIKINVTSADSASGRKKDSANCALAKACVREKIADAAIIGIGFSYLIKGKIATRYKTSNSVSREITSFDRHQDFAEGNDYTLSKVGPSARLGKFKGDGGP